MAAAALMPSPEAYSAAQSEPAPDPVLGSDAGTLVLVLDADADADAGGGGGGGGAIVLIIILIRVFMFFFFFDRELGSCFFFKNLYSC